MAKNEQVKYSNEERFDVEFKKRQDHILKELQRWSESEDFRLQARKEVIATLENHDSLTKLSGRLFENGCFLSSFKQLAQSEIVSHKKNSLWERWSKLAWLIVGAVILWFFEHGPLFN